MNQPQPQLDVIRERLGSLFAYTYADNNKVCFCTDSMKCHYMCYHDKRSGDLKIKRIARHYTLRGAVAAFNRLN